jgi:hypothetical protein
MWSIIASIGGFFLDFFYRNKKKKEEAKKRWITWIRSRSDNPTNSAQANREYDDAISDFDKEQTPDS